MYNFVLVDQFSTKCSAVVLANRFPGVSLALWLLGPETDLIQILETNQQKQPSDGGDCY